MQSLALAYYRGMLVPPVCSFEMPATDTVYVSGLPADITETGPPALHPTRRRCPQVLFALITHQGREPLR